jgi:nucleoside 2-deoxyribosyltransferase
MKIYFAGAIRGGREDQKSYLEIIELLRGYGQVLTEHIGEENLSASGEDLDDKVISNRDLGWLKEANCLVAEVTTPSLGVGFELGKATEWQKPVLCLYRPAAGRRLSALIAGSSRVSVFEYQTVAELKEVFDKFFGKKLPPDGGKSFA